MNYLIIGANAAGLSAAVRIQKNDKSAQICVLEKSDVVSFGACGLPYFIAGEFTDIAQMTARPLEDFLKSGIDIRLFHEAKSVDFQNKKVFSRDVAAQKDSDFAYDKLLIASGASPLRPPIKGADLPHVHTLHSKHDALAIMEKLPQVSSVAIVGAGFIGVEAAEAFAARGKKVTLIEAMPQVLMHAFDREIAHLIEESLRANKVDLHLHEKVLEISPIKVHTERAEVAADLVILATGFQPNTHFLRDTDLRLAEQGAIVIDELCQTNLPDVYAAGDCATVCHALGGKAYIPLATTANKLGRLAGEAMSGKAKAFIGTLGSSGVRVFDREAGRTGLSDIELQKRQIEFSSVFIEDKNHTDYVAGQSAMWVKLHYDKQTRVLLGGQICGAWQSGAVHRIDALAIAIYKKMTVDELGFMDFVYAPPFSRTWDILNVAGNVAK